MGRCGGCTAKGFQKLEEGKATGVEHPDLGPRPGCCHPHLPDSKKQQDATQELAILAQGTALHGHQEPLAIHLAAQCPNQELLAPTYTIAVLLFPSLELLSRGKYITLPQQVEAKGTTEPVHLDPSYHVYTQLPKAQDQYRPQT
ncbi:hypothetical protein PAL_GLEAN10003921 [Pteropus alecto]|uniref:Uncharacterized protein n=1 Tax=Pteropus alecto TaxID=9402 RepID=L5KQP9_PTEAL|nr:hypothetical protein PAL_GLEAN10003921 [Pteropus alecto]